MAFNDGPDVDDIIDMSEHLLETINRIYQEAGIAVPELQYYVIGGQGQTAHDCEQLTVSWDQAYSGLPEAEASVPAQCDQIHTARFVIEVVREVKSVRPFIDPNTGQTVQPTLNRPAAYGRGGSTMKIEKPDAELMKLEAQQQMRDAILLLRAGLIAGEGTTGNRAIVDVSAGAPSGNYQAVIMNFTAALGLDNF